MIEQIGRWLETLEPYTSYRVALGFVLGAIFIYTVAEALISVRGFFSLLRELDEVAHKRRVLDAARLAVNPALDLASLPSARARPGRTLRLLVMGAAFRAAGWKTVRRCWFELALLALLLPACGAAYYYLFAGLGEAL